MGKRNGCAPEAYLEHCVQIWASILGKMELLEWILKAMMIRGLKYLSYEDKLKELSLFSREKTAGKPQCGLQIFKGIL